MKSRALDLLAERLGRAARRRKVMVATAESCTGGGIGEAITRIAGSSAWFDRGFITYSNSAKRDLLGVAEGTMLRHGAVSEEVVREMAAGAIARSSARVSVAVTGIAGPGGGTPGKPVGLVWFAWAVRDGTVQSRSFHLHGSRAAIRQQSVAIALEGLIQLLK